MDTGVFFAPGALERLAQLPHPVTVPAVVFTERARQLARRGIEPEDFRERLAANDFRVEPYGVEDACRWTSDIHDDEAWRRLARDAMIAGHLDLERGDVLWTTNTADFVEIGVPRDHLATVEVG